MTAAARFIRQPWEQPPERWTNQELSAARALKLQGFDNASIADLLAEAGYPPRDETDVGWKVRGHKARGQKAQGRR